MARSGRVDGGDGASARIWHGGGVIGGMLARHAASAARRRGNRARDARRWGEAIAAYRHYLGLVPEDAAIHVQLGHALSEAGDFAAADRAYAAADQLRPDDADLLLCWGHSRKRAGDPDAARALYVRSHAVDQNPHAAGELAERSDEMVPPEEQASPERPFAGRIDRVYGRTIEGVIALEDHADTAEVAFHAHGRIVGQVRGPRCRAEDREVWFKTVLDVDGEVEVRALRSDGAELENSPARTASPHRAGSGAPPAWAARLETVKPFGMPPGGEVALFVTHSRTGALKPHVLPYLRALAAEGIAVLLIAQTDRPLHIAADVLDTVAGALVRENRGYDFAAWAHAIRLHPEVYGASILYLVNDSLVGPADPQRLAAMLGRVRASTADLIGLTESQEYRWHLQTFFLALKPRLLASWRLHGFFNDVRLLDDKDAVIRAYEVRFTGEVEDSGHRVEVLFPSRVAMNPTLHAWRALIADGFPFMKALLLRGHFPHADSEGWRATLAEAGFDLALIDATLHASEEEVPWDGDQRLFAHPIPHDPAIGRPLKVAFYGPWNYDNGLGAASRGMIAAIQRSGVRLNLHPIKKPFHIHRPLAPPIDVVDFEGPADIAVVHLNPDSWFLLTDEQRDAIRAARKRIGYWVWEMGHLPPAWRHDFSSVDRIWAPSRYCAKVFAAQDEARVDVIPHAVPLPPSATIDRRGALAALGLPAGRRIILFVFDGSSYLVRKNPAALVRAFSSSGLADAGWTLVLKTKHLMDRAEEGAALQALAEATPQVVLIDRTLAAGELAALWQLADIYASPHCSEGFGLTVAEAMAAGKPVVATDFGGTTDLLDNETGYPVRAHRWRLDDDFGHYTRGGEWARIDEPALTATLLRAAHDLEVGDDRLAQAGRARVAERLSYKAVGRLIAASFRDVMTGRGASPRIERITPRLTAGVPFEQADLGPHLRAVPLAADGAPLPGTAGLPGDWPADREHWVAFAPAGSLVTPVFTRIVMEAARDRPDVGIFYADDVAAEVDQPADHIRCKPAFDLTLLAAQDYAGAPLIVRASTMAALNGLDPERGTAAIADLLFRASAAGISIERIPEVLLAHPGRRIAATPADYRAMLEAQPALAAYDVVAGRTPTSFALARRFLAETMPPVTIVIPTRRSLLPDGSVTYVERLLTAIAATDWPMDRLHVLIGDDIEGEPRWLRADWPFALTRIETPRAADAPFNYAAKMNRLWHAATTEQVVLLNDDVCPLDGGWLKALQTFALDEGVGGVGARLLFDDGTLQHAGMAPHGPGAAHVWLFRERAEGTYQDWALVQREWSMVTGAVFATRRSVLERVDGFDERFALEFNDTDLCLRLRTLGYRIVYAPMAEMVHTEKASRGSGLPPGEDMALFLSRWSAWLRADPCWHPQLRLDRLDMTPRVDGEAWYM